MGYKLVVSNYEHLILFFWGESMGKYRISFSYTKAGFGEDMEFFKTFIVGTEKSVEHLQKTFPEGFRKAYPHCKLKKFTVEAVT